METALDHIKLLLSCSKWAGKQLWTGCIKYAWHYGKQKAKWMGTFHFYMPSKEGWPHLTLWTIALVSPASQIILRIILEQAGFWWGSSTRDQIINLHIIMQKAREHQQPLYMHFVDFKKAFDSVLLKKHMWIMINIGYLVPGAYPRVATVLGEKDFSMTFFPNLFHHSIQNFTQLLRHREVSKWYWCSLYCL